MTRIPAVVGGLLLAGCSGMPLPTAQTARSPRGMVVTAHPVSTAAGLRMLASGGNAADAAVAAAFAISVVEPSMNSIGGRTQILYFFDGEAGGIDATTAVPLGYDPARETPAESGYATVGVPGAVAGLVRLQAERGVLPLATVMAPAIRAARRGHVLLEGEARRLEAGAAGGLPASVAALFQRPDGSPYRVRDRLVQRSLAATLEAIAAGGADAFYRGDVARRIAADMDANGGTVDLASLADYRAESARIVSGSYRGLELVGSDVPAAGAVVIEALQILEHFPLADLDPVGWAAVVGQALQLAFDDSSLLGSTAAAADLTSKAHAAARAQSVRVPAGSARAPASAADAFLPAGPLGRPPAPDWTGASWGRHSTHTSHLTTSDRDGNVVALTQTLGPLMGAKVATPGLGFLWATTMGGYLGRAEPGDRARSFIAPMMLLEDGQPLLVLGAAGGARIVSAVVQTICRVVDQGLELDAALAAPRVHPRGVPGDPTSARGVVLETTAGTGWPPSVVAQLATVLEVETIDRPAAFGRVHAVRRRDGQWIGAADPDWEGAAAGR